jgi:uncharacterized protein YbjT (DUF2867 family)
MSDSAQVILVTGGTGTLGRPLVSCLRAQGHQVRVLSRRPGAGTHTGDLATGAGVAGAAGGADVVIHAASDTRRLGRADLRQTRHLLQAVGVAAHLIYLSIVGIDEMGLGYYRRKLACEQEILRSGVRHTIVRATQFHELIAAALRASERLPVAPLPAGWVFQPVAAADVAGRIAELAAGRPMGRAPDFGGPQVLSVEQIARTWRAHRGRPRAFLPVPVPGRAGRDFRHGLNTCPGHADGTLTWDLFLTSRTPGTAGRRHG